jgi:uncharacterized 2Fe-2S/4Fe-4S cluster protein (DUF4445 family)
MRIKIKTQSSEHIIEAEPGAKLDLLILSTGILLDRPCGGRGKCGKCRAEVRGEVSELTETEKKALTRADREAGLRLACQTHVTGDAEAMIESAAVFTDKTFTIGADLDMVPGPFGLALDLGTTTVAAFLAGLEDARVYAGNATLNQQARYGAEVMSRLMAGGDDAAALKGSAWSSLVEAASGLGLSAGARSRVEKAVVVGNSAMSHLALGLPVDTLIRSPFEPFSTAAEKAAPGPLSELFPGLSEIKFAPLIQGFVGSDALACLVYFGLFRDHENALALDLGTNGEVLLAAGGRILAASTAAGPAFEGVNISCGMRAAPGAITSMRWDAGCGPVFDTIADEPPRGLAGSGLLSAVRVLRDLGAIDPSGRISGPDKAQGLEIETADEIKRIIVSKNVWIGQPDVRELQKAKGAVRAAVEILLETAGLDADGLSRVILTGSFGGRLDPEDVVALGVMPAVPVSRMRSIPNGAGMGAAMMLDDDIFNEACSLAKRVEHVELNLDPSFMDRYVANMVLASEDALKSDECDKR